MKNKRGVSLIVLVINIIVLIILAAAVILTLANNNPVENANEATFKSDLANVKDLVNLASTDILLGKVNENEAYKGIIPPEYETKIDIENGILYYIGEAGQEEEWAKEIGVVRKEFLPDDWIDISKSTPENGISLLIGKPETSSATIKFKVTSTGKYKVDWGDGSSNSYASGTEASHIYSTNNDKSSTDGYLFQVNITPDGGEITKFENTQWDYNSPLLWCQVGCDTLENCYQMFYNASKLKKFGILTDTSLNQVKNMNYMFSGCSSLKTIPYFDTSQVTTMEDMLRGCSSLTEIPKLDTSQVTKMDYMFIGCSSLKTIPLLNTSNVTIMSNMFMNCSSLETIPSLDTSKVTNMGYMFSGCSSLKTIQKLDISKVTSMDSIFSECNNLKSINISNMNLTSEQINNVFAELPESTNSAEIDITGNPGESGCTRATATGKGWVVIP